MAQKRPESSQDIHLYRPSKKLKAVMVPNLFAQFTALANKHQAVNLGQGFPSFGSPGFLRQAVADVMADDVFAEESAPASLGNQYTRPGGDPGLVKAIAQEYSPRFGRELDPMSEVVVTIGAQEAIFTSLFAWTEPGDDVVAVVPCYDAVAKSAQTCGLQFRGVALRQRTSVGTGQLCASGWQLDLSELKAALTPQTRVLLLNNPGSPLGKVFSAEELAGIASVVQRYPNLLVISDEVYERCVYGECAHSHFAVQPGMYERTMSLFSAGKTFSCTGWRIGYIIAPPQLTAPLLASHAAMNFCAATPLQKATVAAFSAASREGYFEWLADTLRGKRDFLIDVLREVGLKPIVPDGGYFVVCDASTAFEKAELSLNGDGVGPETPLDDQPDVKLCKWFTERVGVTAIPVSPFYPACMRHNANHFIRFAFCKDKAALSLAAERLRTWHASCSKPVDQKD